MVGSKERQMVLRSVERTVERKVVLKVEMMGGKLVGMMVGRKGLHSVDWKVETIGAQRAILRASWMDGK